VWQISQDRSSANAASNREVVGCRLRPSVNGYGLGKPSSDLSIRPLRSLEKNVMQKVIVLSFISAYNLG
jgi:hypothetical protein